MLFHSFDPSLPFIDVFSLSETFAQGGTRKAAQEPRHLILLFSMY